MEKTLSCYCSLVYSNFISIAKNYSNGAGSQAIRTFFTYTNVNRDQNM